MKIYKHKMLFEAVPFAIQWETTTANNDKTIAAKKAKGEIKLRYQLLTGKMIEHEILSVKEV